MRLVLLGSRDTIIGKNNSRRDLWRNIEGLRNGIWYEIELEIVE